MITTTLLLASAASLWGQSISLAPMAFGIHRTGGVTGRASYGPWLVSGRSDLSFNEMVLLDLYYVEHQSLLFDLEILFETLPAVLFGRGAY